MSTVWYGQKPIARIQEKRRFQVDPTVPRRDVYKKLFTAVRREAGRQENDWLFPSQQLFKLRGLADGVEALVLLGFGHEVAGLGILLMALGAAGQRLAQILQGFGGFIQAGLERGEVI